MLIIHDEIILLTSYFIIFFLNLLNKYEFFDLKRLDL